MSKLTNQQKENIISKFKEIRPNLTSENGFPIFDLMIGNKQDHYISASDIVFYSENEALVSELQSCKSEDYRAFLENNLDKLFRLSEVKEVAGIMDHSAAMAFSHLYTPKRLKETLTKGYYGVAHLIVGSELLIFRQNLSEIDSLYSKRGGTIGNLNDISDYSEFQDSLKKLYDTGKIKPESVIAKGAFDKVMTVLIGNDFYQLNDYQKEVLLLLKDFNREVKITEVVKIEQIEGRHFAIMDFKGEQFKILLPEEKGQQFEITYQGVTEKVSGMPVALYVLNGHFSDNKMNNFIKSRNIMG